MRTLLRTLANYLDVMPRNHFFAPVAGEDFSFVRNFSSAITFARSSSGIAFSLSAVCLRRVALDSENFINLLVGHFVHRRAAFEPDIGIYHAYGKVLFFGRELVGVVLELVLVFYSGGAGLSAALLGGAVRGHNLHRIPAGCQHDRARRQCRCDHQYGRRGWRGRRGAGISPARARASVAGGAPSNVRSGVSPGFVMPGFPFSRVPVLLLKPTLKLCWDHDVSSSSGRGFNIASSASTSRHMAYWRALSRSLLSFNAMTAACTDDAARALRDGLADRPTVMNSPVSGFQCLASWSPSRSRT